VDIERCWFLGHCHDMAEAVVGDIPTSAGMEKCKCVASRSGPNTDKCQRGSTN